MTFLASSLLLQVFLSPTQGFSSSFLGDASNKEKNDGSETTADDKAAGHLSDTGQVTQLSSSRNSASQGEPKVTNNRVIVEDLFAHRNAICVPYRRLSSAR